MTDKIDEMFVSDLNKLSMPSELAMNAAKVKAAQDPGKKGAEKPDLYAKGKGRGKGGRMAEDEENDERKSKGPNKGEKKEEKDDKNDVGAKTAADESERAYTATRYYKKRFLRPGMKEVRRTLAIRGKIPVGAPVPKPEPTMSKKSSLTDKEAAFKHLSISDVEAMKAKPSTTKALVDKLKANKGKAALVGGGLVAAGVGAKMLHDKNKTEKKASIDDEFNADMRQIVGAESMNKESDWERPDVSVDGQTTDRIDDHFISWMQEKADEDVVKEANWKQNLAREIADNPEVSRIAKGIGKGMRRGALLGVGGTLAAGGLAAGGMKAYQAGKKKGEEKAEKKAELDKEAGVQQNPENLDLLARIRKSAEEKAGLGLLAGTGDV